MSRSPGIQMSEEAKRKAAETRLAKKRTGIPSCPRPIIRLTGKEEDAFDFVPLIRVAFRSIRRYDMSAMVSMEVRKLIGWRNRQAVIEFLKKYLEVIDSADAE